MNLYIKKKKKNQTKNNRKQSQPQALSTFLVGFSFGKPPNRGGEGHGTERKYFKRGYKIRCSMKSELNSPSIQPWGLYSGNYSLTQAPHRPSRLSQCSLSLTEWEFRNTLATTHMVSVPSSGPPASLSTYSCVAEVYDTETRTWTKHQEIQIQLTHLITPQLAAPQATSFSLFRVANSCFLGCVL